MAAFLVIGKRRVRFRFFVIIALLLGGIGYLLFGSHHKAAYTAINYGQLDVIHSNLAVIIREDTTYEAPAYGRAVYLVADGSAVEADQSIAVLYKENFDEDIVKELYDIQEKIIQYQEEQLLDQAINKDLLNVNEELHLLVSNIQGYLKSEKFIETAKLESKLRKLLDNKQKLLDLETDPDEYLTGLYEKEAKLVAQIKQWTIDVKAPKSGLISFAIDEFENVLGLSAVDKLTTEDYLHIIEQNPLDDSTQQDDEGQQTAITQAQQSFFRIADPLAKWYVALKCEGSEIYLNKGDVVTAYFDGKDTVNAIVSRIQKEKDYSLVILEFTEQVDGIINKRVLPLRIQKTVEGLLLPEDALKKNKGRQGVYIRDKEGNRFIETSVQARQNGFVIVESVSDTQDLKLHDQVLTDNE